MVEYVSNKHQVLRLNSCSKKGKKGEHGKTCVEDSNILWQIKQQIYTWEKNRQMHPEILSEQN